MAASTLADMPAGVIALLGSGETAPGMTKVHRELLSRYENPQLINLDTTYGFQENVVEMSAKLAEYFEVSLQHDLRTIPFARFEGSSPVEQATLRQAIENAHYIFAGPGSPSYAIEQWRAVDVASSLREALARGATICFASAASLTLGSHVAPIYEIYKAGSSLYWLDGLNLMSVAGLQCVVIPHFDNAEGANYDTSCCYLGKRRLEIMEAQLPPGTATLGIDEHTVAIIDLERQTLRVTGRGAVHWRTGGQQLDIGPEVTVDLASLPSATTPLTLTASPAPTTDIDDLATTALRGGADGAAAIARLVALAQTGGEGYINPGPLVEGVLAARVAARAAKQFELADSLRDALVEAGIQVNDGPNGTTWSIGS